MKMYAKDYRVRAHETCKPYENDLALICFVYSLMMGALGGLSYIGIGAVGLLVVAGPFVFSWILIIKKVYAKEKPEMGDLFKGFDYFAKALVVYLLKTLYTFLWSLLFIIPGIIKTYSYAMAEYIMLDDSEISANDAITKSREMMNGHKWELFCLEFSYIGWIILCMLTAGILFFWVGPRMQAARYAFYLNISGKSEVKEEVVEQVEVVE